MVALRPLAVAGSFYPAKADALRAMIAPWLDVVGAPAGPAPKAVIAPHAGYIYSGALAGACHRLFLPDADRISRVVLIGPAHRVGFRGIALSTADQWATPLGAITLDRAGMAALSGQSMVGALDAAHGPDHALEVHLPFLRMVLPEARLIPCLVGQVEVDAVAAVLERLWGQDETRIVISSDLSHYLGYHEARALDQTTAAAIEAMDGAAIAPGGACGRLPIAGFLTVARARGLRAGRVGLMNSGDTAGGKDKVVGYGGWRFDRD